jgi:hypothetical protein
VLIMRGVLVLAILCGAAHAQVMANDPAQPSDRVQREDHPPAGLGMGLVFGWAGQKDGKSGWSARLDEEIYSIYTKHGFFGAMPGFEVWRSGTDNWGFSLPVGIVGGVRVEPLRLTMGVGVDAFLVDQVDDDTGVGFYAPFAMAKLGFDIRGIQMGMDTRIGYRWQFGAADHTRWQLGFYVAYTAETPPRRPRKPMIRASALGYEDARDP